MNYFLENLNYFNRLPYELIEKITDNIFIERAYFHDLLREQRYFHTRFIRDRLRITVNLCKIYQNNTIHYNTNSRLKFNMALVEENFYKS